VSSSSALDVRITGAVVPTITPAPFDFAKNPKDLYSMLPDSMFGVRSTSDL